LISKAAGFYALKTGPLREQGSSFLAIAFFHAVILSRAKDPRIRWSNYLGGIDFGRGEEGEERAKPSLTPVRRATARDVGNVGVQRAGLSRELR
jgi:hypothetical protein